MKSAQWRAAPEITGKEQQHVTPPLSYVHTWVRTHIREERASPREGKEWKLKPHSLVLREHDGLPCVFVSAFFWQVLYRTRRKVAGRVRVTVKGKVKVKEGGLCVHVAHWVE